MHTPCSSNIPVTVHTTAVLLVVMRNNPITTTISHHHYSNGHITPLDLLPNHHCTLVPPKIQRRTLKTLHHHLYSILQRVNHPQQPLCIVVQPGVAGHHRTQLPHTGGLSAKIGDGCNLGT